MEESQCQIWQLWNHIKSILVLWLSNTIKWIQHLLINYENTHVHIFMHSTYLCTYICKTCIFCFSLKGSDHNIKKNYVKQWSVIYFLKVSSMIPQVNSGHLTEAFWVAWILQNFSVKSLFLVPPLEPHSTHIHCCEWCCTVYWSMFWKASYFSTVLIISNTSMYK